MILGSYSEKAFVDLEGFREQISNLVEELEVSGISLPYAIGYSYSHYCKKEPNTVILYLAFMCTMQTQKFISSNSLTLQQENILAIRNKELFIELITLYKCYRELDFQSFLSLFYFEEENRSKLTRDLLNIFLGYSYLDFAKQNTEQETAEFLEGVFTASIEEIYTYIFPDDFLANCNKQRVIPELSTLSLLWKGKFSEVRLAEQLNSELGKLFKISSEQEQRVKDLLIKHNLYETNPIQYHENAKDFLDQIIEALDAENKRLKELKKLELRKKLEEDANRLNTAFEEEQQKIHKQVMDSIASQSAAIKAQIEQNYRANLNAAEQAYREESRVALTSFACGIGRSIRLDNCSMFDRPSSGIAASFSLSGTEGAKFNVSMAQGGRVGTMDFVPGAAQYARWQQVLQNKAQYAQIDAALNEARWKSIHAPEGQIERARTLISQIGKLSQMDTSCFAPLMSVDTRKNFFGKQARDGRTELVNLSSVKLKVDSTLQWLKNNKLKEGFADRNKYTFKDFFAPRYQVRLERLERSIFGDYQLSSGKAQVIQNHGLIDSRVREQQRTSFTMKAIDTVFDIIMPAAYAEEMPEEQVSSDFATQTNVPRHYQVGSAVSDLFFSGSTTTGGSFASKHREDSSSKSWHQQYGEMLLEDAQDEFDQAKTTLGIVTGAVTQGAKIIVETGRLLYRAAQHAANTDLLNNPEYAGSLSEATKIRLQQEINQDHEVVHAVLDPIIENPGVVGKAIVTHFHNQLKEVDEKLKQGDYFEAGKQTGEIMVDVATTVSSGYGTVKAGIGIASKLSIRALDLATDAVVSSIKGSVSTTPILTMHELQRKAAILRETRANISVRGEHIKIPKAAAVTIKADGAEFAQIPAMARSSRESLPCRLAKNDGFDGAWLDRTDTGEIKSITLVESKYNQYGKLILSNTKTKGKQMSERWIRETLKDMLKSSDPEVCATAKLIRDNKDKLVYKANVLSPDGVNKWYSLTPTENGVVINNKPKPIATPKSTPK